MTATLFNFGNDCWGSIDRNYDGFSDIKVWMGPGYACYCVCLFGAFMRALFHWLTPLPGRGSGCIPALPKSLVKKLDRDGDGKVCVYNVYIDTTFCGLLMDFAHMISAYMLLLLLF